MAKAARASPVFDVCFFLLVFAVVDHLWLYFARFWSVHNVQAFFFTFIKTHLHPELSPASASSKFISPGKEEWN